MIIISRHKKFNDYKIDGDTTIIYINDNINNKKYECYIDTDDFDKIKDVSWHINNTDRGVKGLYARATKYIGIIDGKPKNECISMHRIIMNLNKNNKQFIDHIDHNTLNNRKNNLRTVENKQNLKNRKSKNINNTSGYRNVSWSKDYKKWLVQLQVNGKNTCLGMFDDVHEAGRFAEQKRKEIYGEFAGATC